MNGKGWAASTIPPDDSPTEVEILTEAHRLVHTVAGVAPCLREVDWVDGRAVVVCGLDLPAVGSRSWWESPPPIRAAAVLALGRAWLVQDPDRRVAEALKQAAVAISAGHRWSDVPPSHADLVRRRSETPRHFLACRVPGCGWEPPEYAGGVVDWGDGRCPEHNPVREGKAA